MTVNYSAMVPTLLERTYRSVVAGVVSRGIAHRVIDAPIGSEPAQTHMLHAP
jgi:hypothetical protein